MFFKYIHYISSITPLFSVALGIYSFKWLESRLKVLFIFVCFAAFSDITAILLLRGINTMPEAHIYALVEFIILTLFYANYLKRYISRKFIWTVISVFTLFSLLNALFIQKITVYPYIVRAIESIVMVIFSILYFHKVMVDAKIKKLSKEPMIWINTGMLLYFSSNFFFHILLPLVVTYSNEFARIMVYYFWVTNILFYLILAIGFYKQKKLAVY